MPLEPPRCLSSGFRKSHSHAKDIKHGFRAACVEAGIEDLTFHDLRHTWSTRAAHCGVTETVRRDILGHSSATMTGDYTHSTSESQMTGYGVGGELQMENPRQNLDKTLFSPLVAGK